MEQCHQCKSYHWADFLIQLIVDHAPWLEGFRQHKLQARSINTMHNTDLAWHVGPTMYLCAWFDSKQGFVKYTTTLVALGTNGCLAHWTSTAPWDTSGDSNTRCWTNAHQLLTMSVGSCAALVSHLVAPTLVVLCMMLLQSLVKVYAQHWPCQAFFDCTS